MERSLDIDARAKAQYRGFFFRNNRFRWSRPEMTVRCLRHVDLTTRDERFAETAADTKPVGNNVLQRFKLAVYCSLLSADIL
jgi:hypothetical protein